MNHIEQSYAILDAAIRLHKPSTVICLFSGGYDSMATAHLTWRWLSRFGHSVTRRVVAIDTLLSADGWRDYVVGSGKALGMAVEIWDNPNPDWYEQDCAKVGTPYTRKAHRIQFINNKERAIAKCHQHYKKHWHDRVMFVTGIRRAESRERQNAPEVERRKTAVWVNPILYWTDEQTTSYRVEHDFRVNPFYDTVGGSGDCQCGWTGKIQLPTLQQYSPQLATKITRIDAQSREVHGWGWGEKPSKSLLAIRAGQLELFEDYEACAPDLCAGCERPEATNEALDYVAMQRMEW